MFGLFRTPHRMEDLALFTRHLSGALAARVPLPDVLRAYVAEAETGALSRAVAAVADRVEAGVDLSAALEDHPRLFPKAYRRLVRLGEQGRALGDVMERLADDLEMGLKSYEITRRMAIYPLIVLLLLFANVTFVLMTIMPKMQAIFEELGMAGLPGPLGDPQSIRLILWGFGFLLLIPVALLLAASLGLRFRAFGYGRLMLQIPLVGPVLRRVETARFARNLSALLAQRVPLDEALGLVSDSTENTYVRAALQDFHQRYTSGERLSDLVAAQPLFPPSMAVMIASAEDQGGLAETLGRLGRFYADRARHGWAVLREVFEPIMLILVGLMVGLVLLSIYMPLFNIPQLVR